MNGSKIENELLETIEKSIKEKSIKGYIILFFKTEIGGILLCIVMGAIRFLAKYWTYGYYDSAFLIGAVIFSVIGIILYTIVSLVVLIWAYFQLK